MTRETKSARIDLRARPSLKARAEAAVERHPDYRSLSDVIDDLLEQWTAREERKAAKQG